MDWSANAAESAALEAWSAGPVSVEVAILSADSVRTEAGFFERKSQKIFFGWMVSIAERQKYKKKKEYSGWCFQKSWFLEKCQDDAPCGR